MSDHELDVEYIGPFQYHAVCMNGWRVPLLTMSKEEGEDGEVMLNLDHRFGLVLPPGIEGRIITAFIAQCIAVASGFTCHPPSRDQEPIPFSRNQPQRMYGITSADTNGPAVDLEDWPVAEGPPRDEHTGR